MASYLGVDVAEAAEELRVSEGTVRRLVREGHLPRVPHMGTRIVIPRTALRRFVATAAEGAEQERPNSG